MIRFTLDQLREKARIRPPGYYEEVLSLAAVDGDSVSLRDEDYRQLIEKYRDTAAAKPPEEPSALELAANFSVAVSKWAAAGFPVVHREVFEARSEVCSACAFWDGSARLGLGKCTHRKCGCTRMKRWLATEGCPLGKWAD
jgi:hypothetical protein